MAGVVTVRRVGLEAAILPLEHLLGFCNLGEVLALCRCSRALRERLYEDSKENDYIFSSKMSELDPFFVWGKVLDPDQKQSTPLFKIAKSSFPNWQSFFRVLAEPASLGSPTVQRALVCSTQLGGSSVCPIAVTKCMRVDIVQNEDEDEEGEGEGEGEGETEPGFHMHAESIWLPVPCQCQELRIRLPPPGRSVDFPPYCDFCCRLVGEQDEDESQILYPSADGMSFASKFCLQCNETHFRAFVGTLSQQIDVADPEAAPAPTAGAGEGEGEIQVQGQGQAIASSVTEPVSSGPGPAFGCLTCPFAKAKAAAALSSSLTSPASAPAAPASASLVEQPQPQPQPQLQLQEQEQEQRELKVNLCIFPLPFNAFLFPKQPSVVATDGDELMAMVVDPANRGKTIGVSGSVVVTEVFIIKQPLRLVGINSKFGAKATLHLVCDGDNGEGPGGTLYVNDNVCIDNLEIESRSEEEEEFNEDPTCFCGVQVAGGAGLILRNCSVTAYTGTALILDAGALSFVDSCSLSSYFGAYTSSPSFLGVVAKSDTIVSLRNCDLMLNMWGCSLGSGLSTEREAVVRRLNSCGDGDSGVTRMYQEYTDTTVNPWWC